MEILKEVELIRASLYAKAPFIASLLMNVRVKVTETVTPTAAVDAGRTLYINPVYWSKLGKSEKFSLLAHETLHLALLHPHRLKKFKLEQLAYNIAADAVVNEILEQHDIKLIRGAVTMEFVEKITGIDYDKLKNLSAEEIYRLIRDKLKPPPSGALRDLEPSSGEEEGGEGGKDWEDYWRDKVYRAAVVAKAVGNLPAGLERIFELLKPKVNWRALLRQALAHGMGTKVVSTYQRINRKHPELPGLKRLTIHNVHVLIDTSGSIDDSELSQFISEVFGIAKSYQTKVLAYYWDAYLQGVEEITSPSHVRSLQPRGGGGTVITPALKELLKRMRAFDAVVILSDGFIGDIEDNDVQLMLQRVSSRASVCVFVTSANVPKLPAKWQTVKIS